MQSRATTRMSADRPAFISLALACSLYACSSIASADALAEASAETLPEIEFLEYLGSWQESDEDWLILNDVQNLRGDIHDQNTDVMRNDPAPEGEESTEKDDEH